MGETEEDYADCWDLVVPRPERPTLDLSDFLSEPLIGTLVVQIYGYRGWAPGFDLLPGEPEPPPYLLGEQTTLNLDQRPTSGTLKFDMVVTDSEGWTCTEARLYEKRGERLSLLSTLPLNPTTGPIKHTVHARLEF